jgi:Uncharacterized protein conserved in bacteria
MHHPLKAEDGGIRNVITCEDGEQFVIEENGTINTSHSEDPKDEMIIIDIRKLKLTFYQNGHPIRIYPVAIGDSGTPSPIGEWKIIHKGGNWGNGFGERWIGLNVPWGIYGIHGTNKPWSIGTRSSHGCIRMFNEHVLELYTRVKLGTPVRIIGDLPKVVPRKDVGRNNTGRDIVAFQFALRKAGFEPGTADGRFGIEMERAVYRLQFFYGLAPTGRVSLNEQYLLGFH